MPPDPFQAKTKKVLDFLKNSGIVNPVKTGKVVLVLHMNQGGLTHVTTSHNTTGGSRTP